MNDQTTQPTNHPNNLGSHQPPSSDGVIEAFPRHLPPVDERAQVPPLESENLASSDTGSNQADPQPSEQLDLGLKTADGHTLRPEDLPDVQIDQKDRDSSTVTPFEEAASTDKAISTNETASTEDGKSEQSQTSSAFESLSSLLHSARASSSAETSSLAASPSSLPEDSSQTPSPTPSTSPSAPPPPTSEPPTSEPLSKSPLKPAPPPFAPFTSTPPPPPTAPPTPPKSRPGRKLFGIDLKAVGAAAALAVFFAVGLAGVMIALRQRTTEPIAPTAPTSTPSATSPAPHACTLTFTVAAGTFSPGCSITTYRNDSSNTVGSYTLSQTATTYNQGGIIVYAVDITNDGSQSSNYLLTDVIDETGLTFMDSNCGANAFDSTANTLTCSTANLGGAIAAGSSTQVIYRVRVSPGTPVGQIDNTVNVRSVRDSSQTTSCSAPVTIQSPSQPAELDLTVDKDDGTGTYTPGGGSIYTITVGNNGPGTATGATLTDTFPATIVSADWTCTSTQGASCGTASGSGNLSETIDVGPNETVTYSVDVKYSATATGSITNTAEVTAPSGSTDTDTSNNIDSDTNNQASTTDSEADLTITKDDGTGTYSAGKANTYTIVVRNNGPSDVTAAKVTDTFPSEISSVVVECSAGSGASCPAGPHNDDIDDLVDIPSGGQVTYTVQATYSNSASGDVTNTARVTAPSGTTDPDTSNNSASDTNSQQGDGGTSTSTTSTSTTSTTTIAQAGAACNEACSANADCADDSHICFNGQCRNATYPDSATCTAPTATGDQPALPEQLPQSGSDDLTTWLKIGLGVLSAGAILLFLL